MKKTILSFIMAGLVCCLMICAGCTGTPAPNTTTTQTSAATPAGTATQTTTTAASTAWAGTWNTTWIEDDENLSPLMNLQQTGSTVSGTFEGSNATISGTVIGTTLTGTLTKFNGTEEFTGSYEFTLSPDLNSFTGKWAFTPQELASSTYFWNGTRV